VERAHVPIVDMRRISHNPVPAPVANRTKEIDELIDLEALDRFDALDASRYAGAFFDHGDERVDDDRVVRVFRG